MVPFPGFYTTHNPAVRLLRAGLGIGGTFLFSRPLNRGYAGEATGGVGGDDGKRSTTDDGPYYVHVGQKKKEARFLVLSSSLRFKRNKD